MFAKSIIAVAAFVACTMANAAVIRVNSGDQVQLVRAANGAVMVVKTVAAPATTAQKATSMLASARMRAGR